MASQNHIQRPVLRVHGTEHIAPPLINPDLSPDDSRISLTNAFVGGPLIIPKTRAKAVGSSTAEHPVEASDDSEPTTPKDPVEAISPSASVTTEASGGSAETTATTNSTNMSAPDNKSEGSYAESQPSDSSGEPCIKNICKKNGDGIKCLNDCKKNKSDSDTEGGSSDATADSSGDSSPKSSESKKGEKKDSGSEQDSSADTSDKVTSSENSTSENEESETNSSKKEASSSDAELGTSGDSEHESSNNEEKYEKGKGRKNKKTNSTATESSGDKSTSDAATTTGGESSEAAATTEGEPSEAASTKQSKSSVDHDADLDWTMSEDGLLRGMKEGNATWANISKALNRNKKDCQNRWKTLQSIDKAVAEIEATEDKEAREKTASKGKATATEADAADKEFEETAKKEVEKTAASRDTDSGNEAGSESSSSSSGSSASTEPNADWEAQYQKQQRYIGRHILQAHHNNPAPLQLRPDRYFSKRDCAVLAAVDSKLKASKWLEMQANFYNVTGQLVPLHLIKAKCEAAEAEERERATEAKVREWAEGVSKSGGGAEEPDA